MTALPRESEVPQRRARPATPQHLLSVSDLGPEGIAEVLRVAEAFAEVERRSVPKVPTLRGKVVATLFFEESDAHAALLRDGGQATLGRRALARRGQLVGQER